MEDINYIKAEIEIKENDINKKIRIINSFEENKREAGLYDKVNDYKYENEKEIKEKCKITINDKIIPFSYFHRFKEKGKYLIKYSFTDNLIKINCSICDFRAICSMDVIL